jgi:hypothetical protein
MNLLTTKRFAFILFSIFLTISLKDLLKKQYKVFKKYLAYATSIDLVRFEQTKIEV